MSVEKNRILVLLQENNYFRVIKCLEEVEKRIQLGLYNDALAKCRLTLEKLYKRLLLNHGFTEIGKNGNKVKKASLLDLII